LAQEVERARWARELHDDTLQELAAAKMLLAVALGGNELEANTEREGMLEHAAALIDSTMHALRHMITDLRPAQLDELGLAAALEALAERTRVLAGLDVDVKVDLAGAAQQAERLPDDVETVVYRLAQEALTNALKHAQATHVAVDVHELDDTVELAVRDDGIGFDASERSEGFGLLGMRERVALAGGALTIQTEAGQGTVVVASIPSGRPVEATANG
jgi:signal transduction histidine kinase